MAADAVSGEPKASIATSTDSSGVFSFEELMRVFAPTDSAFWSESELMSIAIT